MVPPIQGLLKTPGKQVFQVFQVFSKETKKNLKKLFSRSLGTDPSHPRSPQDLWKVGFLSFLGFLGFLEGRNDAGRDIKFAASSRDHMKPTTSFSRIQLVIANLLFGKLNKPLSEKLTKTTDKGTMTTGTNPQQPKPFTSARLLVFLPTVSLLLPCLFILHAQVQSYFLKTY